MPSRPKVYRPFAKPAAAGPTAVRRYDPRPRGTTTERGYGGRWQKLRLVVLGAEPLCRECRKLGKVVEATDVDHIVPHKGDPVLMWEIDNLQPLCARHHSAKTAREDGGFGRPVKSRPRPESTDA